MCAALPTLKASPEFQHIAKAGRRYHAPAFILQILKRDDDALMRVGFTASRKVGNAVIRNRAKRRLKEIVRAYIKTSSPKGFDIVLIAKTAAAADDFGAMTAAFQKTLKDAGVLA